MATFHLQVVTPDALKYDGQAERVLVRTITGDVCILANHIDYAAALSVGEARVTDAEGNTRVAACHGGMISVQNNEVRVIATTFEWGNEIDLARAQAAEKRAEEEMARLKQSDAAYAVAEARLKRAIARIGASSK